MQFNRKALIEAADKARVRHRAVWEERVQAAADEEADNRKEWVEAHRDKWIDACNNIVNKLTLGEPVVESDIPLNTGRGGHYQAIYRSRQSQPVQVKYQEPNELKALIALLETVEDDVVTSSALKNLGFGQGTMSSVVGHLGRISRS